ncbi:MAG: hypothetical protein R3C01_01515 [Planctomycetaceae bacterium]
MSLDSLTIDRIVAGILKQMSGGAVARPVALPDRSVTPHSVSPTVNGHTPITAQTPSAATTPAGVNLLDEKVVTAQLLEQILGGSRVLVGAKAIVTPAAWDAAKERNLVVERRLAASPAADVSIGSAPMANGSVERKAPSDATTATTAGLIIVVKSTESVERLKQDLDASWRPELVGGPDDAAQLVISEIARGGAQVAVIFAEQTYRAACLANRHDKVKAAPVRDALDVKQARKEMRINTWCVNPISRTWYELRNLMLAIQATSQ